jgi:hypothetical protein
MAAKKSKPAKKKDASPRGSVTSRSAGKNMSKKAPDRGLVPAKKVTRPSAAEKAESGQSPLEPAVLPTPFATFVF